MEQSYDIIIIGGGITGTSLACELAKYESRVVLIEKEAELGFGVSKSNSGIVHTGFQSSPGSLKGKLAVRGNELYEQLSARLEFPYRRTGELVVAFSGERDRLELIREQGRQLGVTGMELVDREWIRHNEPNLSSEIEYALLGPSAAVINPYETIYAMYENAQVNGVAYHCGEEVTAITNRQDLWVVYTESGVYSGRYVLNCAGLHADDISRMAGIDCPVIRPKKGEEFLLDRHAGHLTDRIIFPLPTAATKGVLIIPTVDGNYMIGPTATEVTDRSELTTTVSGKQTVVEHIRRLLPGFSPVHVIAAFAGLRPSSDHGDFYIREEGRGFVNLLGIDSPGLTAAPAIAEYVREMISEGIRLIPKKDHCSTRKAIPRVRELSEQQRNELISADPSYGEVICRCELVTKGEIVEAIRRGARTLDGIKFRTRCQMGRCHGAFCTMKIAAILAEELGVPYEQITKRGKGSELAV